MASKRPPVVRLPLGASRGRLSFERRVRLWLWAFALTAVASAGMLAYEASGSLSVALLAVAGLALVWALVASVFFEQLVRPLQTLANIIASLREDDFSFRARGSRRGDAMGDLALEINLLAAAMQKQRSSALDALTLAERVMLSMPSPVLAFDQQGRLRLLNAAAERAFAINHKSAIGHTAAALHLSTLLESADEALYAGPAETAVRGDGPVRWSVRRSAFRLHGVPHTLLMLTDVAAVLREEERSAWQRLIRVLGHEINNSLTPIKSIAGSLRGRLAVSPASADFERGLAVIENRAESLNRFLQAYRQLMGLPTPRLECTSLAGLIDRVVQLEARLPVLTMPSKDIAVSVDAAQIEQALINLLRNAVEAALSPDAAKDTAPCVRLHWQQTADEVVVSIVDSGPGLTNEANLFVPFYTTKPEGTGIGLVLAQQIAEAHSGSVRLSNRPDAQGCIAELRLPWKDVSSAR